MSDDPNFAFSLAPSKEYRLVQAEWRIHDPSVPAEIAGPLLSWAHIALNWSDSEFENLAYFCPICASIWATARTSLGGLTRCINRRCFACGGGALALTGGEQSFRFELPYPLLAREAKLAIRASNYFDLLTSWNGKAAIRPRTEHELGLITARPIDIG